MANKHLSLKHNQIVDGCWWYEEEKGITVVVQHTDDNDSYSHTQLYLIPWKHIRAALGRKDLPRTGKKS